MATPGSRRCCAPSRAPGRRPAAAGSRGRSAERSAAHGVWSGRSRRAGRRAGTRARSRARGREPGHRRGPREGRLSGPTRQPVPVTIRIGSGRDRGEVAARGLATLGNAAAGDTSVHAAVTVSLPAQTMTPGWWVGEAALEPDELRADDRRPFAWRVAAPARVSATAGAGAFVSAALRSEEHT